MNATSSAPVSQRVTDSEGKRAGLYKAFLFTISLLLSIRLFILINNHAVNILYWDQWGFFEPLFEGKHWWQLFRWQHGPWRQGAGVLSYLLAELTHWNSRAEAFFIGGLVWLAMAAALWLKRRMFGKLVIYDIAIPMIVLTTAQFQTFVGPVSSAPTAFPMLLIVLYCLAWTVQHALFRNALVLLFNFLLVYTGYGLFIGGVTMALLVVECWKQKTDPRQMMISLIAMIISVLTVISFLSSYDLEHFHTSVQQHSARIWEYPIFACLMFGRVVRLNPSGINWLAYVATLCGIGLFTLLVVALLTHTRRIISYGTERVSEPSLRENTNLENAGCSRASLRTQSLIIVILLGYGFLFAISTALGRAAMGLNGSQSSRFVTLMIPAFLGLYFHLLTLDGWRYQRHAMLAFLLLLVPGHLPLKLGDSHPGSTFSQPKRAWRDCYLQTEDFQKCEAMSDFKLLPADAPDELQKKFDYLKQHRLNLFLNQNRER